MIGSIKDFNQVFFIGVAGTGMSAIAQYLKGIGKEVAGSDRYFGAGVFNETEEKLEAAGIKCFVQDGQGITSATDLVVVSTAVEDTVPEVQKAKALGIPIIKRSELLSLITNSKRTIAVGGTSGKSTTSAMLFDILDHAGLRPSIISGAGLVSLIKKEKIGNAQVGDGEWLVIEADESDGSIVQYHAEIGLLLNVDKDHKEIETLMEVFTIFQEHSQKFIVNLSHPLAAKLSKSIKNDFSLDATSGAGFIATGLSQKGLSIDFYINDIPFHLDSIGRHNMENVLAAVTVANQIGVPLNICAEAIANYQGIYRRTQVMGKKDGVMLIDDYAHNPVKCAAAIRACQPVAPKVIAWFQPHGYGPTKFLRNDFVDEITQALRPQDEIWMSEIFYAGGTAIKDISANDLITDLQARGAQAFFVEHRSELVAQLRPHFTDECVLLLMGARDPSLEQFAKQVWGEL